MLLHYMLMSRYESCNAATLHDSEFFAADDITAHGQNPSRRNVADGAPSHVRAAQAPRKSRGKKIAHTWTVPLEGTASLADRRASNGRRRRERVARVPPRKSV